MSFVIFAFLNVFWYCNNTNDFDLARLNEFERLEFETGRVYDVHVYSFFFFFNNFKNEILECAVFDYHHSPNIYCRLNIKKKKKP